ncbi:hypothetical protein TCON_1913 [Astathelohania contejeani]|uniref:Uncharacterized protein n=1 Tax=Astathelohania contejeani TaxID=164912 RepID=A0ABQ7HXG4_9MICR|nr:hypothetical protein TCON_1913 [Thelohania contejeani]
MCDVAKILQTVQWCYQEVTPIKPKPKSQWYENINNKINTLSSSIALLNKAKDRSKLSGIETIEAKRIMRKSNLTFEKPHELTEDIVFLKESIRIYCKKLEMYAKRKDRRRENQCFELYRGKFYRRLSEEAQMVHGVDVEKIKEYWSTMWVKPNVTNKNYEKYLVEYCPNLSTQPLSQSSKN